MLERLHHIGQVSVNKQLLSSLGPPYISALSLKYTYYVIFQTFSNELWELPANFLVISLKKNPIVSTFSQYLDYYPNTIIIPIGKNRFFPFSFSYLVNKSWQISIFKFLLYTLQCDKPAWTYFYSPFPQLLYSLTFPALTPAPNIWTSFKSKQFIRITYIAYKYNEIQLLRQSRTITALVSRHSTLHFTMLSPSFY